MMRHDEFAGCVLYWQGVFARLPGVSAAKLQTMSDCVGPAGPLRCTGVLMSHGTAPVCGVVD